MGTQKQHLTQFFCRKNLSYMQNNCIYWFKKYQPYWIMTGTVLFPKKYNFMKIWLHNFFLDKVVRCTQNNKKYFFSGGVMWKLKVAAFQNTLELYHDQRIWGRNYCVNLDNAVLLPPKNAIFALFLKIKPFFIMKKLNHHSKLLTPLESYDWDNVFALFWGVNLFWFWR